MKFRTYNIFLYAFFLVAVGFSFQTETFAHDFRGFSHSQDLDIDAEAENVGVSDKDSIEKITLHLTKHIAMIHESDLSRTDKGKELVILAQRTRQPGIFNNGEVYSVLVNPEGYILNHGVHPQLHFKRYFPTYEFKDRDGSTTGTMQALLDRSENPAPVCMNYHHDGQDRTLCAGGSYVFSAGGPVVFLVGFDHEENDDSLVRAVNPGCAANEALYTLSVTAKQVNDEQDLQKKEDLLVQYVKAVAEKFKERTRQIALELFAEDASIFQIASGLVPGTTPEDIKAAEEEISLRSIKTQLRTTSCVISGDFRYGSIYPFSMKVNDGTVVINGLDVHLFGLSVSLTDPDPVQPDGGNILGAFRNAVTDGTGNLESLAEGNNGFVTYHWDNPETIEDNNEFFLEKGEVPGFSLKKGYIEVINATPPEFAAAGAAPDWEIIGSGIYLDDPEDGDDGCSIAATADTSRTTLLNLFLIMSVLFSAVLLRKN